MFSFIVCKRRLCPQLSCSSLSHSWKLNLLNLFYVRDYMLSSLISLPSEECLIHLKFVPEYPVEDLHRYHHYNLLIHFLPCVFFLIVRKVFLVSTLNHHCFLWTHTSVSYFFLISVQCKSLKKYDGLKKLGKSLYCKNNTSQVLKVWKSKITNQCGLKGSYIIAWNMKNSLVIWKALNYIFTLYQNKIELTFKLYP